MRKLLLFFGIDTNVSAWKKKIEAGKVSLEEGLQRLTDDEIAQSIKLLKASPMKEIKTIYGEQIVYQDLRVEEYLDKLESLLRFRQKEADRKEREKIDWENLVLNQENFLLETEFTPSHWERVEYDWHKWHDVQLNPKRTFWFSVVINGKKYKLEKEIFFTFENGKWTEYWGEEGRDFSDAEVKDIVKNVLLNGRDDRERDLLYYRAWAWIKQDTHEADKKAVAERIRKEKIKEKIRYRLKKVYTNKPCLP